MWLSVTKSLNSYSWSAEENSGRSNRSASVSVATTTLPIHSASTSYTQSGASPFVSILSTNPRTVGSSQGTLNVSCTTNLASVDVFVSGGTAGKNHLELTYAGASGQPGVSITGTGVGTSGSDTTGFRLVFNGDPGMSSSFQFFVTYSYGDNTAGRDLFGNIYFVTNSILQTTQYVTQSHGGETPVTGSEGGGDEQ